MGCVYKIIFPSGFFYIGATESIESRLYGHWSAKNYVSDRIREEFSSYKKLNRATIVEYYGDDFKREEKELIYFEKDNPQLMNKLKTDPNKPKLEKVDSPYNRILDKIKNSGLSRGATNKGIKRTARAIYRQVQRELHNDPYSEQGKNDIRCMVVKINQQDLLEFYYAEMVKRAKEFPGIFKELTL